MASLSAILQAHAPLLLLDAASARVQVGWLLDPDARSGRWFAAEGEAIVELFRAIESLGADPSTANGFAFCEGPGSILGIRTAAMAIRTWRALRDRPAFAYSALALLASAGPKKRVWIADGRRGLWHRHQSGEGWTRVPAPALAGGDLATPREFRRWAPLPEGTREVSYDVAALFGVSVDADLLRPVAEPDAFMHAPPEYAAWQGGIHHAEAASSPSSPLSGDGADAGSTRP